MFSSEMEVFGCLLQALEKQPGPQTQGRMYAVCARQFTYLNNMDEDNEAFNYYKRCHTRACLDYKWQENLS